MLPLTMSDPTEAGVGSYIQDIERRDIRHQLEGPLQWIWQKVGIASCAISGG